jgi:hypothetical protein
MKRRAAVEPTIGHLAEHRLERNRLKGTQGNALISAAAKNFEQLGGFFLCRLLHFLRLLFAPTTRDQVWR